MLWRRGADPGAGGAASPGCAASPAHWGLEKRSPGWLFMPLIRKMCGLPATLDRSKQVTGLPRTGQRTRGRGANSFFQSTLKVQPPERERCFKGPGGLGQDPEFYPELEGLSRRGRSCDFFLNLLFSHSCPTFLPTSLPHSIPTHAHSQSPTLISVFKVASPCSVETKDR